MKIGFKRHLKRIALSLFHMGYYCDEYDDILPGDIYVLDSDDAHNPFKDIDLPKVEIVKVKNDYLFFKQLQSGMSVGSDSMSKKDFLKKYFREKDV